MVADQMREDTLETSLDTSATMYYAFHYLQYFGQRYIGEFHAYFCHTSLHVLSSYKRTSDKAK